MGTEDNSLLLNQKNKLLFRLFWQTFSRELFLKRDETGFAEGGAQLPSSGGKTKSMILQKNSPELPTGVPCLLVSCEDKIQKSPGNI